MKTEWQQQMRDSVDTIEKLEKFINLSDSERHALETLKTTWGTTPYFAALMDRDDPNCPIRKQVIPSMFETENRFGMKDYLVWKENRATEEVRPDCIARQYKDRVAFTVTQVCGIYCRHCFRKELVVDKDLKLSFDVDEGLKWIAGHPEVRDILITGGDPFLLSDEQLDYLITKLREIPHIQMIRFGSRLPVVLPQRITPGLLKVLGGYHRVPIWLNTQVNHPKEITELTAKAATKSKKADTGMQASRMPEITLSLPAALGALVIILLIGAAVVGDAGDSREAHAPDCGTRKEATWRVRTSSSS